MSSNNSIDSGSGILPTVKVTWGYWDTSSNSFNKSSGTYTAVEVTVSRTAKKNNAVALTWGTVIGNPSCGLTVTSVAACISATQTVRFNLPAASDPYLAGMPSGSTASTDDTTSNAPPYQVPSITVTPGSILTFTSLAGLTNYHNQTANDGPAGEGGFVTNHTPNGGENGIGDADIPIDSLVGLFLGSTAPNLNPTPPYIDWTSSSNANQAQYNSLLIQQPFYVGNGKTTGGVVQQFRVPAGATRLYLANWDGYEWKNDTGSFTGSVTVTPAVQMMQ